jgi:transposase-like protein
MKTKEIKRQVKPTETILAPHFQDEDKAREYLEALRWPDGAVCPHCGLIGEAYKLTPKPKPIVETKPKQSKAQATKRVRTARKGLWKCAGCRKQFTVTVKTIFEDSHIPLHIWLLATHLIGSSKKGMSAHQLMRNLGLGSYKSAWFMAHRIRYAMTGELPEKMTGIVEADETYIGGRRRRKQSYTMKDGQRTEDLLGPFADKAAVFSVVQRGGKVHSRHVERVTADNLKTVLNEVCADDAHLMTDSSTTLKSVGRGRKHSLVNHKADEYVRYDEGVCVTTNTVEGYFATLKRGINGVYHHVGRKHLHRYLSEFDFRYNNRTVTDGTRANEVLKGFEGKRLTYKQPIGKSGDSL